MDVSDLADRACPGRVEVIADCRTDVLLEIPSGRLELVCEESAQRLCRGEGARQLERLDDNPEVLLVAEKSSFDLGQVGRVAGAQADSAG